MKRIALLITVCLLALSQSAFAPLAVVGGAPAAGGECSVLYCETFDGTGYDQGVCGTAPCWTETLNNGIVDEDHTSNCDSGSCLLVDEDGVGSPNSTFTLTTPLDNIYIYFKHYGTKLSSGQHQIASILDASDGAECSLHVQADEDWHLTEGPGIEQTTPGYPETGGTAYHIWMEYEKGTGSNATCRVYASTDGTKTLLMTDSNGTSTDQAAKFQVRTMDISSTTNVIDTLEIDSSPIGAK